MTYSMTVRRKVAIATWSSPKEGNIYGKLCLDVSEAIKYIDYLRRTTGEKITITHVVGKATAMALAAAPDLNGRIFLGRYYPHKTVDVSFLVTLEDGGDLAKFKVCDLDKKSVTDLAKELRQGSERIRAGKDQEFEKPKAILKILPTFLVRFMLWFTGYLTGAMGIDAKALGVRKYPFGAAIITSMGMFDIDEGFAPPTPFARVPLYVTIPGIKKRPVVVDDQVVIRSMLDMTATIDHRFLDGHRGSVLAKQVRKLVQNPWLMDGLAQAPDFSRIDHIDHV
jgi:pyruvate/2-oxoglutarate dehydrogenase complex dihydrolipoamide acyltransferase (E2) component